LVPVSFIESDTGPDDGVETLSVEMGDVDELKVASFEIGDSVEDDELRSFKFITFFVDC
jgi:hypothetical protein